MALRQLDQPFPTFTDLDGSPLDAGYVYFGVENDNPETAPITVYYDAGLTQAAAQPLRTSNGYVLRNGAPAVLYADVAYSIAVRNKAQALVFYSQSDSLSLGGTLLAPNNLSDVASASASLVNLGLTATAAELNQIDGKTVIGSDTNLLTAPAITGQALKLLRVNAGETAAEFIDPATVVLAEAPELSQVQVENPASTVFGQVSGERLSQAIDAQVPALIPAQSYEFLSRTVISGTPALVDFTFDATNYDEIVFKLANIVPATDLAALWLRTSTDGGTIYDSGSSSYDWVLDELAASSTPGATVTGAINNAQIVLTGAIGSAAGEDGVFGEVRIPAPSLTKKTSVFGNVSYRGNLDIGYGARVHGTRKSSADVNAARFLFSSGNFEDGGIITMFGVRNS